MPINYAMMGVNVFSGISFYAVVQYYKYRESQAFWTKTLSERYQQAENIRTNKTMFWWCVFSVIHRMLAGAVQIYRGFVRANENSETFPYLASIFELGSARVAPPHVQEVQTIQAHFNNLVNTWNVDFNKKNVNRNEKR
uniref:DUF4328 domain-containing protein n=1 Tax=Panagrellus redivivus TaxID=6233 RepID=A0A7E4VXE6_PANRE